MKIIIELEGAYDKAEIKKVTNTVAEQQTIPNSVVNMSSSPIDAGNARIADGYGNDTTTVGSAQQLQGATSFSSGGAIDAGAAKVQDIVAQASAMPDTGNMETFNSSNAFSAGSLANPVSN